MSSQGGASPYYPWDDKRIDDPDSPSDGFNVVHPDRGVDHIEYVMVTHGLNADFSPLPECNWVRCRKCGFPGVNTSRSPKGWGTGISHSMAGYVDNYGWGGGAWGGNYTPSVADPEVTSGCPFCGTYIYD